jgi:transposase
MNKNSIDKKVEVLKKYIQGSLSKQNAIRILRISEKTFSRYLKRYQENGIEGLIHKNSNKTPHNKFSKDTKESVITFYKSNDAFKEFNFTHLFRFYKKTIDYEKKPFGYSTFRQILLRSGIKSKYKYKTNNSNRYGYNATTYDFGERVETDACETNWYGTEEKSKLHLCVDRGTGAPLAGHMEDQETTKGYFEVTKQMVEKYGFPIEDRTDCRMSFTNNKNDGNLAQFERVMIENDVFMSSSSVPESKPCVERMNRTFEDQLRSEFIYFGIKDNASANEYIPIFIENYNKEYNKIPDGIKSVFRPAPKDFDYNLEFSFRYKRVLHRNGSIYYNGDIYQIVLSENDILNKDLDGEIIVTMNDDLLFESILGVNEMKFVKRNKNTKSHIQREDHPWKTFHNISEDKYKDVNINFVSENVQCKKDKVA